MIYILRMIFFFTFFNSTKCCIIFKYLLDFLLLRSSWFSWMHDGFSIYIYSIYTPSSMEIANKNMVLGCINPDIYIYIYIYIYIWIYIAKCRIISFPIHRCLSMAFSAVIFQSLLYSTIFMNFLVSFFLMVPFKQLMGNLSCSIFISWSNHFKLLISFQYCLLCTSYLSNHIISNFFSSSFWKYSFWSS